MRPTLWRTTAKRQVFRAGWNLWEGQVTLCLGGLTYWVRKLDDGQFSIVREVATKFCSQARYKGYLSARKNASDRLWRMLRPIVSNGLLESRDDADLEADVWIRHPRLDTGPRRGLPLGHPSVPNGVHGLEVANVGEI